MTEGLKPYPSYKDSGIEWMGKVPGHWEVIRSKHLFLCIDVRSKTGQEELLTVSSEKGIIPRNSATVTMFKAASYVGYKLCWPGDLVINSLWAWARGLGVSLFHGIISTAYGVYRPVTDIDTKYLHELVRSKAFHWELRVRSKGIWISRLQLTDDSFLNTKLPFPPITEQTAIARYLNYIDRRIKRYINSKERLIKLLEEQKQAVIHQAVTGQIDVRTGKPYPKYKDSGVGWLGKVPEGWEVRRLKTICSMKSGDNITSEVIEEEGNYPVYGGNGIRGYYNAYTHDGSYILIGRQGALCGNIHCVTGKFWASEHAVVTTPFNVITSIEWFGNILEIMNLNQYSISAAQPGISVDRILRLDLPMPPNKEQNEIASLINKVTYLNKNMIGKLKTQISLMKEYRTRLIADVVTGKVDVREIAEGLPDEADEPEDFIEINDGDEEPLPEEAEVS